MNDMDFLMLYINIGFLIIFLYFIKLYFITHDRIEDVETKVKTIAIPQVEIIMMGDTIAMDMRNGFYNYGKVVDTDEHYVYFKIPMRAFIDKLPRIYLRYSHGRQWNEIPKRIREKPMC